jgi:hypothetical protein
MDREDGVIDIQYRRSREIPKRAACDATLILPGMVVFRDFNCPHFPQSSGERVVQFQNTARRHPSSPDRDACAQ